MPKVENINIYLQIFKPSLNLFTLNSRGASRLHKENMHKMENYISEGVLSHAFLFSCSPL